MIKSGHPWWRKCFRQWSLSDADVVRMRNAPLRRLVIALASVLVILAAFATGTGMYTAALALWPLLLVWWPWLVAVVALGAWRLWWRLPKREVDRLRLTIRDPKARTDVEDNFRKIAQLLLAATALVGAGLAYLPFQQQQRSSHDVLISNQVAKGFELLGNKDKEPLQRLGGIYALEGVMNNSVLEALSAFVRVETKTETGEGPPPDDIQAALTVITRRKSGFKELPLFLGKAHIPKADLGGTNLTRAHLVGADLTRADLSGANLTSADLTDVQSLTQEQLDKACGTGVRGLDKLDPPLTIKPR